MKKSNNKTFSFLCGLIFFVFSGSACTVKKFVEPLHASSFITQPKRLSKPKNLPFRLAWVSPEITTRLYDDVIVNSVLSDMLDTDKWVFSAGTFVGSKEKYIERVLEVSDYLQDSIAEELEKKKKELDMETVTVERGLAENTDSEQDSDLNAEPLPYLEPIERGMRTLLIEVSIAEMTFGDPLIYGGLFAVPVPGVATLSSGLKAPSLTVEIKFVDKATGEVITEIIDRRFPPVRVIDLNRLVIEQSLKELADTYAEDIATLFFNDSKQDIPGRWPVAILPW